MSITTRTARVIRTNPEFFIRLFVAILFTALSRRLRAAALHELANLDAGIERAGAALDAPVITQVTSRTTGKYVQLFATMSDGTGRYLFMLDDPAEGFDEVDYLGMTDDEARDRYLDFQASKAGYVHDDRGHLHAVNDD